MSDRDRDPLFEMLDPPPGGLSRLRARIRVDRRRRIRNWSMVALASSLLIILSMVVLLRPHGEKALALPGLESDLLAIRLGLVEVPAETVSIRPDLRQKYAVQQIPTTDERIVFYMVGSR